MIANPFIELRNQLNATTKEISTAVGLSHVTIEQIERGLIKKPVKYAQALQDSGLVESAEQLLTDHQKWLVKLQQERLQELKRRAS
jgi:DNA-binding XRE family transcriptional regulator